MKTPRNIIFYFIICLLFKHSAIAQHSIQNKLSPNDYKPSIIELKKSLIRRHSATNQEFVFIDERDDTTRMGFFWGSNKQYYFTFAKPATVYLSEKINIKNRGTPIDTLYMGIKRLWISQIQIPPSLTRTFLLNSNSSIGYCRIICNFYKKRGTDYFLMHTYDSIVSKNGYLGNIKDNLIEENLSAMAIVADRMSHNKINSATEKLLYIGAKKSKPIILSSKTFNDGIYLNFDDFLKNKPIAINFDYKVLDTEEKLILNELRTDDSVFTKNSWGFCKNNIPYMRVGPIFSKLTKIENTFELRTLESLQFKHSKKADAFWLGFNIASHIKEGFPLFALFDIATFKKSPNTIMRIAPFKLDIETGEVY
ncbi:MAG: hypothetical protein ACR2KX_17345 [Chitinophagaceae bacterium]